MKVTEYEGHKVPEGATNYQPETNHLRESFWDDSGYFWVIGILEEWIKAKHGAPKNLIELPEQPAKSDEWVPVIGEECEVNNPDFWRRGFYIGLDKAGNHVYQVSSSMTICTTNNINDFRKPKTAEEKKREAFIDRCFDTSVMGRAVDSEKLFGGLFDAGFTAPKGGE